MVIFSTSFIFIKPASGWIEQYGWEDTSTLFGTQISKVKIQAHAVYNDNDQGGVAAFGVWINGEYDTSYYTRIVTYIYVLAEYEVEEINWKTG